VVLENLELFRLEIQHRLSVASGVRVYPDEVGLSPKDGRLLLLLRRRRRLSDRSSGPTGRKCKERKETSHRLILSPDRRGLAGVFESTLHHLRSHASGKQSLSTLSIGRDKHAEDEFPANFANQVVLVGMAVD